MRAFPFWIVALLSSVGCSSSKCGRDVDCKLDTSLEVRSPSEEEILTRRLFEQQHVAVLPGKYSFRALMVELEEQTGVVIQIDSSIENCISHNVVHVDSQVAMSASQFLRQVCLNVNLGFQVLPCRIKITSTQQGEPELVARYFDLHPFVIMPNVSASAETVTTWPFRKRNGFQRLASAKEALRRFRVLNELDWSAVGTGAGVTPSGFLVVVQSRENQQYIASHIYVRKD